MKNFSSSLIIFLLSISCLHAQKGSISFDWSNETLENCFAEIEQTAEVRFYYAKDWLSEVEVSMEITGSDIDEVLSQLFEGIDLHYFKEGNNIIVTTYPVIQALQFDSDEPTELINQFSRELVDKEVEIVGARKRNIQTAELTGRIVDVAGNGIVGATFYISSIDRSAVSGQDGQYSLEVSPGRYSASVQSIGFESKSKEFLIYSDGALDITLEEEAIRLDEIAVIAGVDKNVTSTMVGLTRLGVEDIKTVPKLFGENDVVLVALALPGVQSVGEGASGINVRGGKTDQNLVLFNNATIYNPFHFFGFFSAFNADITGQTDLFKGSIPVSYGGRLSAILDVKRKKGDTSKFAGKIGISPVTSSMGLNIPVFENTSVVVGARGTYSDWVTQLVDNETIKNSEPQFYDIALGVDHVINEKQKY